VICSKPFSARADSVSVKEKLCGDCLLKILSGLIEQGRMRKLGPNEVLVECKFCEDTFIAALESPAALDRICPDCRITREMLRLAEGGIA